MIRLMHMLILLALTIPLAAQAGEIRFDFETGDLQGWQVMDGRFGAPVCARDMCRNTPNVPLNKQGRYFLSTVELEGGAFDDGMTGVIESPVFVLSDPVVTFLIGGGAHVDTRVALCDEDGVEVRTAHGANAELMTQVRWRVPEMVGRKAFLRITDRVTTGWGHVTFDDFRAKGRIDDAATAALRRTFAEREKKRIAREQAEAAAREVERKRKLEVLMSQDKLFERGETRVYRGEHLGAISLPIGGIGAGCVQIDGSAVRRIWQIFNNHTQAFVPDSFFAVRAARNSGRAVVRALQTEPLGPFTPVKDLKFRGEYPFGWYAFADDALPVKVGLEVFSPLVPLDAKSSAIPCAVFSLTAENPGTSPVEVSFLAAQQNAVGFAGQGEIDGLSHESYGGNRNRATRLDGATVLHMTSDVSREAPGYGDMALMALAGKATAVAEWSDIDKLRASFERGDLRESGSAGPSSAGRTINGALAVPFTLQPKEKRTVTFVLAWHFPNASNGSGGWAYAGNMYSNWYPSALHVAMDLKDRLPELTRLTRAYHDAFYASNLPHWLLDRITSQVAILSSRTCFWSKDGYFGGWEGCASTEGCCLGNCSHVWHYAQAHARLFPEIGRRMREQELDHQNAEGGVAHRQAPNFEPATDGQMGTILGAHREHLMSTDRAWLDRNWPRVKKAMDYVITTWDKDEDGVLAGRQWNTLDDALGGSTSWMGTLYLASLAACERMAALEGDAASAERYARIRLLGSDAQNKTLWNGEYYIQIPDPEPRKDYGAGCHIDQLLGQWWANQLDLGLVYPLDREQTALRSLMKHNFRTDFRGITQVPRKFVADEDMAMQMITWPRGGRPDPEHCIYYGDEVMTGFEYAAAAAMVQSGLVKEGFTVVKAISDRYDGRLRTGLTPGGTASWGYSGNPFGDDECGKFYARAMSVWSMLLACQGFIYDGPAARIGFKPVWRPNDHASFFTAAEGWGLFTQRRTDGEQVNRIEVRYGTLDLKSLMLQPPTGVVLKEVTVSISGRQTDSAHEVKDGTLTITFPMKLTLMAAEVLTVLAR